MSPQELDGRLDELLTVGRIGHGDGEPTGKRNLGRKDHRGWTWTEPV